MHHDKPFQTVRSHLAWSCPWYAVRQDEIILPNGICDEVGHIFLATGVTLGPTAHETAEVMTVHTRPVTAVLQMAHSGQISDGPSALALLLCEPYLPPIFNHG
jgi:hypothetical protein